MLEWEVSEEGCKGWGPVLSEALGRTAEHTGVKAIGIKRNSWNFEAGV